MSPNCASLAQFDHFALFLDLLHLPGGVHGKWEGFGVMEIMMGLQESCKCLARMYVCEICTLI